MRMLFLTTRLPFPPAGGERLRPFYFIKYLSRNWKITILSFKERKEEKEDAKIYGLDNVSVKTVLLPRYLSYAKTFGGLFCNKPLECSYYSSRKMSEELNNEISSSRYELVFCHLLRMAEYAKEYTGQKKVLDLSDALSLRYSLASKLRPGIPAFIERLEASRLKGYEPEISAKFDLNLISSRKDADYLRIRGVKKLEVIENGIDETDLEFFSGLTEPKKIVFFANMRTFHNVDAALYFYNKIFPLVKEKIRDAHFTIVGANIPKEVSALSKDNSVTVIGDVAQIKPFVSGACVSVAPMRLAVGVQNKILQSMAYRIPVVTTSMGLGGIRAQEGREILLADEPKDFAAKVVMLMQQENIRQGIIENAYKLVKEQYLWQDIIEGLNRKLISLAG